MEFVREHEFDLALHAACDYLLEVPCMLNVNILDQVERLHTMMKIEDDCVKRLGLSWPATSNRD